MKLFKAIHIKKKHFLIAVAAIACVEVYLSGSPCRNKSFLYYFCPDRKEASDLLC